MLNFSQKINNFSELLIRDVKRVLRQALLATITMMTLIYAKSHWLFLTHWKTSSYLHISQTFQPKRSRRKGRVWKRGVAVLDVKFTVKNLPFLHCKTARKFIFIEVMSTHAYCVWASIKVIFFTQKEKKVVGILFAGQG